MPNLEMRGTREKKKILPLIIALGNKMIKEIGLTEKIDSVVKWDKSRWNVSPGNLVKGLILSTFFDVRAPLSRVSGRYEGMDTEYLFGEGVRAEQINEYNIGEAMDRVSEIDFNGIYEVIAQAAIKMNEIPGERLHADTTTISFYGEYDEDEVELSSEEREELLKIERGYNKDGRPLDNQVVVGQVVNEHGIPIISRTLDGSTSDVEWNKIAVEHLQMMNENAQSKGILVADSKLCTNELITTMSNPETGLPFVTRCPASFGDKLESRMIEKLYKQDEMNELGKFGQGKKASVYKGKSFIEEVCGQPLRVLAVHSTALEEKASIALNKAREEVNPLVKEIEKKTFACYADAKQELDQLQKHKKLRLFDCTYEIEKTINEKWPRGRRSLETKPKTEERYRIHLLKICPNPDKTARFIQNESSIVILSNVMSDTADDRELLGIYKGQQVVETSFRLLKQPNIASVIYLKNTNRVEVLSMILTLALLIRAILQFKMRDGLAKRLTENPTEIIKAGWNGKQLNNPTFMLLYEHTKNSFFEKEANDQYSFEWINSETEYKVMILLELMQLEVTDLL